MATTHMSRARRLGRFATVVVGTLGLALGSLMIAPAASAAEGDGTVTINAYKAWAGAHPGDQAEISVSVDGERQTGDSAPEQATDTPILTSQGTVGDLVQVAESIYGDGTYDIDLQCLAGDVKIYDAHVSGARAKPDGNTFETPEPSRPRN